MKNGWHLKTLINLRRRRLEIYRQLYRLAAGNDLLQQEYLCKIVNLQSWLEENQS